MLENVYTFGARRVKTRRPLLNTAALTETEANISTAALSASLSHFSIPLRGRRLPLDAMERASQWTRRRRHRARRSADQRPLDVSIRRNGQNHHLTGACP